MTSKRLLLSSVVVSSLVLAPAAFGQDLGGGAAAPTMTAPAVPEAEAAGEDQPTTPEGEEQPPGEENGEEQPPVEENGEEAPPGDDGGGTGGESTGTLPRTGLELLAMTMIGLGLLLAGGALWPTSSWPPPRDRLSRSTPRR